MEEVLKLVDLGFPIIPLCPDTHINVSPRHKQMCRCPGKMPLIKNWQTHNETTEEHLMSWQQQFKEFNIGMPLGSSSGYCGIDVDGEIGSQLLQEMSKGEVPDTWEFSTSAGKRLLYLIPPGTKTRKYKQADAKIKHEECALLCDGQQTVLPPSIHHQGHIYTWIEGHSPWDMDCTTAPQWLMDLIIDDSERTSESKEVTYEVPLMQDPLDDVAAEFCQMDFIATEAPQVVEASKVKLQKGKSGNQLKIDESILNTPIVEGQRDNTMTSIVGHFCAKRELRLLGKDTLMQVCQDYNTKWCDPPLEKEAITQKVNYFFDLEQMKDAKFKEANADKPAFKASELAAVVRDIIINEYNIHIAYDPGSKIFYFAKTDKGPWSGSFDPNIIHRYIRRVITDPKHGHPSWDKMSYIVEVRKAYEELHTSAFTAANSFDIGRNAEALSQYIVLKNGMLDWRTGRLIPWDPTYRTTLSFDFEYNPEADCPRFKKYLADWLPYTDTQGVIQEYLGYCLVPSTRFRKALFLYGKGRNGKSMLLEYLFKLFGKHCSSLSYDGLSTRFGPAALKDALVNIHDDTTISFTKDTSIIKNLIAGGTVRAEYKGTNAFEFTNVAKFIYSAQETPKVSDTTLAWHDRWIFIQFKQTFATSAKVARQIESDLTEETTGIFNWMIEGLVRLNKNDVFSKSIELTKNTVEYRASNDSVMEFINEMCRADEEEVGTRIFTLYAIYLEWARISHVKPVGKKKFAERIGDAGYEKVKGHINGKSGQTFVKNLIVDKNSEVYQESALEYTIIAQGT
jgi:P4 family phage/plasmid primase-like protien